jgi:hypothetical protein
MRQFRLHDKQVQYVRASITSDINSLMSKVTCAEESGEHLCVVFRLANNLLGDAPAVVSREDGSRSTAPSLHLMGQDMEDTQISVKHMPMMQQSR